MERLPIDAVLPDVVAGLRERQRVVLRAEPGAGKTTRVPPTLLDVGAGERPEVVVVEPRRIAARAAAARIADERGTPLGREVGYRVRFEAAGGEATRLWFVTEGVFGRRLAADPFIERVGVVVLDEFHERHLDGDLALAVVRHLQDTVRPDLGLVVMSATVEAHDVARALPGAVVIETPGRAHPVEIAFAERHPERRDVATRVARALPGALTGDDGDVLVFLAGARDIRRTAEAIAPLCAAREVDVQMLHGMQPLAEQQRVLRRGSRRRVVLATNVAETALTVAGVTTVIDGGEARVARFEPRLGVNRLDVVPISRAAAAQRAGRAGRTRPGRCLRLWSAADDAGRRAVETPEILRLDLARLVLAVHAWGMASLDELRWLDAPPPASVARATTLLRELDALDESGLTDVGRRLLALPLEPRLARVALEAERLGAGADGALLVALAGERDVVRRRPGTGGPRLAEWPTGASDLLLRMDLFHEAERSGFAADRCRALGLDRDALRTVARTRRQIARGRADGAAGEEALLRALLAGFPDRVARRRAPGSSRALMVGGTGVVLAAESVVRDAELFVCIDVEAAGRGPESLVRIASAVREEWLAALPDGIRHERGLEWDADHDRVVERVQRRHRDVVLADHVRTDVDRAAAAPVLEAAAVADPPRAAALDDVGVRLLTRLRFLRGVAGPEAGIPDPAALLVEAVRAAAGGCVSFAELRRAGVMRILVGALPHDVRRRLDADAPDTWRLPSGRRVPVVYDADRPPRVAARIQETFGLAETPRLGGGRVPLVVELLAPNGRPVQVTDDLASFWQTTYAEVRRQLRGRYPKHEWPDDPVSARPSAGPKRRR